jgi:hypothetical protein
MRTSAAAVADVEADGLVTGAADTDVDGVLLPLLQAASAAPPAVAATAPRNTRRVISELFVDAVADVESSDVGMTTFSSGDTALTQTFG